MAAYESTEKTCTRCGKTQPIGEFYRRSSRGSNARESRCRSCKCAVAAAWKIEHPSRVEEVARRYRAAHDDEHRSAVRKHEHEQALVTLPLAVNSGKEWTGPELEILTRRELTDTTAALMLGRTSRAVSQQRHLLSVDPRKINLAGVSR